MDLGEWAGFAAPVLAIVGIVVANRMQRGTQREMYPAQVIDDMRGEIAGLRAEVAEAKKEAATARQEAADARDDTRQANVRERLRDDYIEELRRMVPPPPPPWPEGLLR